MGRLLLWAMIGAIVAAPLAAQEAAVRSMSLDPGLDTSVAPLGAIVQTVEAYWHLRSPGRTPTGLWTTRLPPRAGDYDLTARLVYQGFDATILQIAPTHAPDSAYQIKTAFYGKQQELGEPRLIALLRLYARREKGRWVLSPALPRTTGGWSHTVIGPITYYHPPGSTLDRDRATKAGHFVDSLAQALGLPEPRHIQYFLAPSPDEMYRILGLDYYVLPSGPNAGRGGRAYPVEGVVLSGDPRLGAAYEHELVHVVLGPSQPTGGRLYLMEEGAATWLGGSGGNSFPVLLAHLRSYQQRHSDVTLWDLLAGHVASGWGTGESEALYATAALMVDSIYRRGGTALLRRALALPSSASVGEQLLPDFLGIQASNADGWWRAQTVLRLHTFRGSTGVQSN